MKKYIFFLVAFCLLVFSSPPVFAQQVITSSLGGDMISTQSATVSASITPVSEPEYQLPYPGLLPDSPLYLIKAFRDRFIGLLISDPLKKAEFDLFQADKRLATAMALFDKKNEKELMAESSLSKGLNYMEEAIAKEKEARKQGKDTLRFRSKLQSSIKKHQQILSGMKQRSNKENRKLFEQLQKRLDDLDKTANIKTL